MHRSLIAAVVAAFLIGSTHLAPTPVSAQGPMMGQAPASPFVGYVRDRALDFIDILRIKLQFGGIGAAARVTSLVQLGVVFTNGPAFGLERRAFGTWYEYKFAAGLSMAYQTDIETSYIWGNEFADPMSAWNQMAPRGYVRNGSYWDDGRDRPFSIAAEAHLLIGADVAVYPEELLDFVLGFFTIDILQDDLWEVSGDPFFNQPGPGPLPPY